MQTSGWGESGPTLELGVELIPPKPHGLNVGRCDSPKDVQGTLLLMSGNTVSQGQFSTGQDTIIFFFVKRIFNGLKGKLNSWWAFIKVKKTSDVKGKFYIISQRGKRPERYRGQVNTLVWGRQNSLLCAAWKRTIMPSDTNPIG